MALRLLFHGGEYIVIVKPKNMDKQHPVLCVSTAEMQLLGFTYGSLMPFLLNEKLNQEVKERNKKFEAEQEDFLNQARQLINKP